jgi:hypothetical protein
VQVLLRVARPFPLLLVPPTSLWRAVRCRAPTPFLQTRVTKKGKGRANEPLAYFSILLLIGNAVGESSAAGDCVESQDTILFFFQK